MSDHCKREVLSPGDLLIKDSLQYKQACLDHFFFIFIVNETLPMIKTIQKQILFSWTPNANYLGFFVIRVLNQLGKGPDYMIINNSLQQIGD